MRPQRSVLLLLLAACAAQDPPPRASDDSDNPADPFDTIVGKVEQGGELIGKPAPPLGVRWLDGEPQDAGKVRLVRWWTDGCALCSNSAVAIAALEKKHGDKLEVVGIYHDKQRGRELSDDQVREFAKTAGYKGTLARDKKWAALNEWWLGAGNRRFTSVTFLLGKQGRIRLVHTGGEFHARGHTDRCLFDPDQCAAEYAAIDAAVTRLVGE